MAISGELTTAVMRRLGCSAETAKTLLTAIFEHAEDANFAFRYARDYGTDNDTEQQTNKLLCGYWDVLTFLKSVL